MSFKLVPANVIVGWVIAKNGSNGDTLGKSTILTAKLLHVMRNSFHLKKQL